MVNLKTITITEFCHKFDACTEGKDWAIANCKSMAEVWETAKPEWLVWIVWIVSREGLADKNKLGLFKCWCASKVWRNMRDSRSKKAVIIARLFYRGKKTEDELSAAWSAAWSAASSAARSAASSAAWSAASSAAWSAQAEYIRKNIPNPFKD